MRRSFPPPATTRRGLVAVVSLLALVAGAWGAPSVAAANATGALPPKVKPPSAPGGPTAGPGVPPSAVGGSQLRLGFCGGDDWEPEIAAAPDGVHVYAVLAHFPGNTACDHGSGHQRRVAIQVSDDGGRTFGPPRVVAARIGGVDYPNQVDCVVTVDPVTGDVYVSFLAWGIGPGTQVVVARSTDFGRTFTAAKINGPACRNCDHPWTAAYDGNVYVAYAQGSHHFLSRSADGGLTWREKDVLNADAVAFPEGAVLASNHDVWFAWGDCTTPNCRGDAAGAYRVSRTVAGTSQTTFATVASAPAGPPCPFNPNCGFAFFGIQDDIAVDEAGNLYLAWQDGQSLHEGSPPVVRVSRCPAGRDCTRSENWDYVSRADDKTASGCAGSACYALFPRIEGAGAGRIAVMWMDDRRGSPLDHTNGWNVWLRTSSDGGSTWDGPSVRASLPDPAIPQSRPNGFRFPYGDYEGIDVTPGPSPRAVMVWGEGFDYTGGPSHAGHIVYRSIAL